MEPKFLDQFERTCRLMKSIADPDKKAGEGSWTLKEILGHLIDSVSNNHQRLIRYLPGQELSFPGYDQEQCVQRACYTSFGFEDLVSLWTLYNRLLFHIYDHIPQPDLDSKIKVGDRPPVTIKDLMADYFAHMAVHEKQIRDAI